MELDINLPMSGSFINQAGQKVEYWRDKDNPDKVKILVDGKPIDWLKHFENEMQKRSEEAAAKHKGLKE